MEYAYAAMILAESGEEINERNLKAVLSAAGADIIESRVKAFVAALENVDIERLVDGEAATPVDGESEGGTALMGAPDQETTEFDGGT